MQIAVIGAGMAGATCARGLADGGHRVTVFEKSRGLGGRLATRRGEGWQADHGAPSFDARTDAFDRQLQVWLQHGVVARWIAPGDDVATVRYVGLPRQNGPVTDLLEGLEVRRDTRVMQVHRGNDGRWGLALEGGGPCADYDAVVLAVPAPQALDCAPDLPAAWRALVAGAVMTPCWSVMLQYETPWLGSAAPPFEGDGQVACASRESSKPGRSGQESWVLQSTPEWAVAHLEAQAADLAAQFDAWAQSRGAPAASGRTAHRWRYAQTQHAVAGGQLYDPASRLGLCGDWLAGGRVEGAWHSGRALAMAMAMQEALT